MNKRIMLICVFLLTGFNSGTDLYGVKAEPMIPYNSYQRLTLESTTTLPASLGVKSVLFNSSHTKLYALNLEGMSIYEFDRVSKTITRTFDFKASKTIGWDYALHKTMSSFAEKPVEGCFSHGDKILWVSLHNAGGIVPILMDSAHVKTSITPLTPKIVMYVRQSLTGHSVTIELPLIKTGKIPKVIVKTADQHLLVSNWGSRTVSILKTNDSIEPYAWKIATIAMPAIPRGIAIDDKNNCAYIGIMGGNNIETISKQNWKITNSIKALNNPRHIVLDSTGRLFVSFNASSQIACIHPQTKKVLFKASTSSNPRTIALSENQKFLFVTCYDGNAIDIFKINEHNFNKIYSLKCKGKPVGIALYEDQDKLEAWVCNYWAGNLRIFTFKKD